MILTCPQCATRYFVREGSIPEDGRNVRCASCANMWRATAADLTVDLSELSQEDVYSDASPPPPPVVQEPPLPTRIREKAKAERRTREAMTAGVVWAVLCAGFALVLVGAVLFRVQVVRIFPATAGAYAAVRLPVNPTGLSLEQVQGGTGLSDGRPSMIISGMERNVETEYRPPAPIRVALFDKAGRRVKEQVSQVEGAPLQPGETRAFTVRIFDPPIDVAEFQVEFSLEALDANRKKAQHEPRGHVAGAKRLPLRGTTATAEPAVEGAHPVEAKPLPSNSPYALPTEGGLRPAAKEP